MWLGCYSAATARQFIRPFTDDGIDATVDNYGTSVRVVNDKGTTVNNNNGVGIRGSGVNGVNNGANDHASGGEAEENVKNGSQQPIRLILLSPHWIFSLE